MVPVPQELSRAERRVVAGIGRDALLADLAGLVAFAPVGGSAGELAVQRWCAERLRGLGLVVDEFEVDVAQEALGPDFPGMEVHRAEVVGVVGVTPPHDGSPRVPALVLCGHTDVVPPGDLSRWSTDPFQLRVDGGRAFGRGVCDMLGGVAAILAAVRAVVTSGVALGRPLAVHLVSGEEDGGVGAYATLGLGHTGAACLIAEPTGGALIPANAGSLTFALEVRGRAAHGSTRTLGESAVDHLPVILEVLRELEAERNAVVAPAFAHLAFAAPISVGIVRAGDWASTVPDRLVAEGRYGVLPGEPLEVARSVFEAAIAAVGDRDDWLRRHPVEVTWPGGAFASGALPDGHPLLGEVLRTVTAVGSPTPPVHGAPYGSDLRHYAGAGIPTLQYGPGHLGQAHATNEWVDVDELVACAATYAVLALRRCGLAGTE